MRRAFVLMFRLVVVVLCLGTAVLWARSYRHGDVFVVIDPSARVLGAASIAGQLIFAGVNVAIDPGQPLHLQGASMPAEEFESVERLLFDDWTTWKHRLAGFGLGRGKIGVMLTPPTYTVLSVPHWFVLLISATPMVLWIRGALRRRRWLRQGRCGACGYDLRSSPDQCPECGSSAPARATQPALAPLAAALLFVLVPSASAADDSRDWRDTVVPELDLSHATLEQALDRIGTLTGRNFVVRWPALESAGIDRGTPTRIHVWDVRLSIALDMVLELAGSAGAPPGWSMPLGWSEDGGVITVSTGGDLDRESVTKVYDVRNLITAVGIATRGRGPQDALDEIMRLITESVDVDSWRDAGGSVGSVRELGSRLVITQTQGNHRQIKHLLSELRSEFAKPPATAGVASTAPATRPTAGVPSRGERRFYDVRDLLRAIEASYANRPLAPRDRPHAGRELVEAVTDNVEPSTWNWAEDWRTIGIVAGRLVVTQSPEVHDLLARFLAELRIELLADAPATRPAISPSAPTPQALPPAGG